MDKYTIAWSEGYDAGYKQAHKDMEELLKKQQDQFEIDLLIDGRSHVE